MDNIIQQLYLTYYGRAADAAGLDYWTQRFEEETLGITLNAFGNSYEYRALLGDTSEEDLINNLYLRAFNRPAEPEGLAYYLQRLEDGRSTLPEIAWHITAGAQGEDAEVLELRLSIADSLTAKIAAIETSYGVFYSGNTDSEIVREFFSDIDNTDTLYPITLKFDELLESLGYRDTEEPWEYQPPVDSFIKGTRDADFLEGTYYDDLIFGGGGDDTLLGGHGSDRMEGVQGNDILDGGPGDDLLIGGLGDDVLTGGDGDDIFRIYEVLYDNNLIMDFETGDKIDVNWLYWYTAVNTKTWTSNWYTNQIGERTSHASHPAQFNRRNPEHSAHTPTTPTNFKVNAPQTSTLFNYIMVTNSREKILFDIDGLGTANSFSQTIVTFNSAIPTSVDITLIYARYEFGGWTGDEIILV